MRTLFNVTALRDEMANKPKGQRLHQFFDGALDKLDEEQLDELSELIKSYSLEVKEQIEKCKISITKETLTND